jgi:regulator of protease activity HflC (stomatin/prohibitin superfamily)
VKERDAGTVNGFVGLILVVLLMGAGIFLLAMESFFLGGLVLLTGLILSSGIVMAQPNQSKALLFFGHYLGTIHQSGLWLGVPFTVRKAVSLKVRNFDGKKLKVNDVEGNPIEIATVVVFKVVDTAKALFDVDNYERFVEIQSESALRHVASLYPYDSFHATGPSLRGNTEEIAGKLAAATLKCCWGGGVGSPTHTPSLLSRNCRGHATAATSFSYSISPPDYCRRSGRHGSDGH